MKLLILVLCIHLFSTCTAQTDSATSKPKDPIVIYAGYGMNSYQLVRMKYPEHAKLTGSSGPYYFRIVNEDKIGEFGIGFSYETLDYLEQVPETNELFNNNYRSISYYLKGNPYLLNRDRIKFYVGLALGLKSQFVSHNGSQYYEIPIEPWSASIEITAGTRLKITDFMGFYFECGIAKSVFQGGLYLRFRYNQHKQD
jgi:hypothetical protein